MPRALGLVGADHYAFFDVTQPLYMPYEVHNVQLLAEPRSPRSDVGMVHKDMEAPSRHGCLGARVELNAPGEGLVFTPAANLSLKPLVAN
eukprot:jgi/Chrpa1/11265/Chrysochromulina_OHIO_Genome00005103-RA